MVREAFEFLCECSSPLEFMYINHIDNFLGTVEGKVD